MSHRVRIAVAGLGYWGPNLARNFAALPGCEVAWLCDANEAALEHVGRAHPAASRSHDLDEVLADDSVDAVVLATPVPTHAALAERVLDAGQALLRREAAGDDGRRRRAGGRGGRRVRAGS